MITIRDRDFKVVSRSKNLRGVLRYPSAVERVDVWPRKDDTAQFGVTWTDGASTISDFASYKVFLDWVKKTKIFRSVPLNTHFK